MKKSINLIVLLFVATISMHGGNTIYVTSADNSGDGTLRDAITTTSVSGDSIVIQDDINEIVLSTQISLSSNKNLAIEGNGCLVRVTNPGTSTSPSTYRCLSFSFTSIMNISLHNLLLKGGNVSAASADNAFGGALYVKRVNLKMYNCTISESYGKKGGAIADCSTVEQNGSMLFVNCTFTGNKASDTGGVLNVTGGTGLTYNFINCLYEGNSNIGSGSTAVFIPRPATFTNCIFRNNISNKTDPSADNVRIAALSVHHGTGTTTVENCLFDGNTSMASTTARHIGGTALVHYNSGNFGATGSLIIKNSTFANNKGGKAAVYLRDGNTTIVNCTFAGNRSGDPAYSGAICMKDSLTNNTLTLVNNIFAYNYAAATYNTYGNTSDVYVLPALETSVSGSNNLIAVTASNLATLTNPVTFTYDGVDPANDSPLFASYTTNTDSKKVPIIDAATGTVPLMAQTSVAIGAGIGASDADYGSLIPAMDQRGETRAATPCIGSYEVITDPTTGTVDNQLNKTKVYANANGQITIVGNKTAATIYNMMGQKLIEQPVTGNFTVINKKLNAGVYLVKTGNKTTKVAVR